MNKIRRAENTDAARLAEIEVFNYRMNFYPIFKEDQFYFGQLQVPDVMKLYLQDEGLLKRTFVFDDGVVKGFIRIREEEIEKLFVEPILQGRGIGAALLDFAVREHQARTLWALEKNARAIAFYQRYGFLPTGDKKLEQDTTEYLIRLERADA